MKAISPKEYKIRNTSKNCIEAFTKIWQIVTFILPWRWQRLSSRSFQGSFPGIVEPGRVLEGVLDLRLLVEHLLEERSVERGWKKSILYFIKILQADGEKSLCAEISPLLYLRNWTIVNYAATLPRHCKLRN